VPYPPAMPLLPAAAPVSVAAVSVAQVVGMTSTSSGVATHHPPPTTTTTGSRGGHGKRASRTHFSDEQVRTLQEHFERNAYPRDDELESLSRRLGLSARVIVVWFQNARQKARRTYENHSSSAGGGGAMSGGAKADDMVAAARYDCRTCGAAFQRYYELIKHQRSHAGCASIVATTTSPTKYPDTADMAATKHDSAQLRYDQPPGTDAAATPVGSPSYRQHHHNYHRRLPAQRTHTEAWYRPPVEGYVGALSPRGGADVINVQHALPAVFQPHLPLMTSWNMATGCKEEAASVGVDMTTGRQHGGLSGSPVDTKYTLNFPVNHSSPEQSAKNHTAGGGQNVVSYVEPLRTDNTVEQSPEMPRNSADETASCYHADNKRPGVEEVASLQLHRRAVTSPSSTGIKLSVERHGRQLFGGRDVVATSPRLSYDDQRRHSISLDNTSFSLSATAGDDDSPLDLSCQGKTTTTTWLTGDSGGEALRETAAVEELKPAGPAAERDGSGTRPQQAAGHSSSKRHRTHMSELQVRVMRAIYVEHRTPSIGECATLGAKIGLARRVVQVWFQNARAKDKKRCATEGRATDEAGASDGDGVMSAGDGRCRWCGITYSVDGCSVREHVFSAEHVAAVDRIVRASTDAERRSAMTGGRAGKRDHRRRLLQRRADTLNSSSEMSSGTPSTTPHSSTIARTFNDLLSLAGVSSRVTTLTAIIDKIYIYNIMVY